MKPKNFVGRRVARKVRAGMDPPKGFEHYVRDIKLRGGRKNRDANGVLK